MIWTSCIVIVAIVAGDFDVGFVDIETMAVSNVIAFIATQLAEVKFEDIVRHRRRKKKPTTKILLKPKTDKMDTDETADSDLLIWEKRLVLMAAFGFVGLGAFFGICSVYVHYIKHQMEKHIAIHSISTPLDRTRNRTSEELKVSVEKAKPVSNARVITVAVETEHRQVRTLSVGTLESSDIAPTYSISMNETSSRSGSMIAKSVGTGTDEAENVELFFANIDELLDGSTANQHDAYGKLKSTGDKLKNVSDFWWRMAKATHIEAQMAEQRQDKDCQKGLLISAVACAEKAV
ncbi:unnamed protein product, partial [Allacma fusca]